jgi:hypothetical protein
MTVQENAIDLAVPSIDEPLHKEERRIAALEIGHKYTASKDVQIGGSPNSCGIGGSMNTVRSGGALSSLCNPASGCRREGRLFTVLD